MNKNIFVLTIAVTLLSGCGTMFTAVEKAITRDINSITPESMSQYPTIHDAIRAHLGVGKALSSGKNKDGTSWYSGNYWFNSSSTTPKTWVDYEYQVPQKVARVYCESREKGLYHHQKNPNVSEKYSQYGLATCKVNNAVKWAIMFEDFTKKQYNNLISIDQTLYNSEQYEAKFNKQPSPEEMAKAQAQKANFEKEMAASRARAEAQRKAKAEFLRMNAPSTKDIGSTICKEDEASVYTGIKVMGQATFDFTKTVVVANLEHFSNDGKNIKVSLRGYLRGNNSIATSDGVFFKGAPLRAGIEIWDSREDWFKCSAR
jgi:hypothetical protein